MHDKLSVPAMRFAMYAALPAVSLWFAACGGDEPSMMRPPVGVGGTLSSAGTGVTIVGGAGAPGGTAGVGPRAGAGTGALPSGMAGRVGGVAGVGAPLPAAGTPGPAPAGAGAAGMGVAGMTAPVAGAPPAAGTGAAGTGGVPMANGPGPTLPAVNGPCPMFTDGATIMVAGHKGVAIAAGAPGKGGPLLFAWHGTGGTAQAGLRQIPAGVRNEIVAAGGIIASFNGASSSQAEGDCSGTRAHNIADFKAADQIAACAVMMHGVDSRRIYSTGCSAGGLQTGCMAYLRSSYLAAAAPNSGGIIGRRQWQDKSAPAIFTMHGSQTGDVVGVAFADTSKALDSDAKNHGSFVVNCNHNGRHCGASPELHTAAWLFMKDHPWGTTPAASPWAKGIPAGVPAYCQVF